MERPHKKLTSDSDDFAFIVNEIISMEIIRPFTTEPLHSFEFYLILRYGGT
jgi:hypothetical protein